MNMKRSLIKVFPYIFYALIFYYIYYEISMEKYNSANETIKMLNQINNVIFSQGLFIVFNIYFISIPFYDAQYFLRYKDKKFYELINYFSKHLIKMFLWIVFIMTLIYIRLDVKLDIDFLKFAFYSLNFILFELILYLLMYSKFVKELFSNILLLIVNILILITYSSVKYFFTTDGSNGIYVMQKDVSTFNVIISMMSIIMIKVVFDSLSKKEVVK